MGGADSGRRFFGECNTDRCLKRKGCVCFIVQMAEFDGQDKWGGKRKTSKSGIENWAGLQFGKDTCLEFPPI